MKKKKDESLREDISPVRLLRDDLERILDTLREAQLEVTLSDSTHVFDSLEDVISGRGQRPRRLKIKGGRGYDSVSIDIRGPQATLSAYGDLLGLGHQLKSILQASIPLRARFLNPWIMFFAIQALFVFDEFFLLFHRGSQTLTFSRLFILPALFLVGLLLAAITDRHLNYGVLLKRRHVGGFWKRNADQLFLLILGTILGAIVTLVVQWFVKQS